ncbi:MAG TPA: HD domain-containing protein, partial [Rickettsia endosymbiont of Bembidion nr. Transversale]|nr:HD domain-containing protein [Rickettsia endosymbiont of Bembidion nr. Transversale]
LVTAILHDTIEDTALTKEKIAEEFGRKVADQVMDLTRIKEDGSKISSSAIVRALRSSNKDEILVIKLFDRLDNIRTLYYKSNLKIKKTIKETMEDFIPAASELRLTSVCGELLYICSSYY